MKAITLPETSNSGWALVATTNIVRGECESAGFGAHYYASKIVGNDSQIPENIQYKTVVFSQSSQGDEKRPMFEVPFHADTVIVRELIEVYYRGEGDGYERACEEIEETHQKDAEASPFEVAHDLTFPKEEDPLAARAQEAVDRRRKGEGVNPCCGDEEKEARIRLFPQGTKIPHDPRQFVMWFSRHFLGALSRELKKIDGAYHGSWMKLSKKIEARDEIIRGLTSRVEDLENGD